MTNAGSNGKFLAVLDLDVRGGKVADYRYKLVPVFSNLLPADPAMGALIDSFGFFGVERIPFDAVRLVGLALLSAGAVLVLHR